MNFSERKISRRTLLQLAAGGVGLAAAGAFWVSGKQPILIGTLESEDETRAAIVIWPYGARRARVIKAPHIYHSFLADRLDANLLWAFPKYRGPAARFDLRSETFPELFPADDGFNFNGHAIYSPNGRQILTSEHSLTGKEGVVHVRDARTFKSVAKYSSGGSRPHEIVFAKEKSDFWIANMGDGIHPESGNLSRINFANGKLREQRLPNKPATLGHLILTDDNWLVAGGRDPSNAGLLWSSGPKGEERWLRPAPEFAEGFREEVATLQVDVSTQRVFALSRAASAMCIWNYRTGKFERAIRDLNTVGLIRRDDEILTLKPKGAEIVSLRGSWLSPETVGRYKTDNWFVGPHLGLFNPSQG